MRSVALVGGIFIPFASSFFLSSSPSRVPVLRVRPHENLLSVEPIFKKGSINLRQTPEDSNSFVEDLPMKSLVTIIGSTTSAVVAGTFYCILAYKRDALMVSFFIGAISNGILSKVLKKILDQERPAELKESELNLPPSDNGKLVGTRLQYSASLPTSFIILTIFFCFQLEWSPCI